MSNHAEKTLAFKKGHECRMLQAPLAAFRVWKSLRDADYEKAVKSYSSIPKNSRLCKGLALNLISRSAKSLHSIGASEAGFLFEEIMDNSHREDKKLEANLYLLDMAFHGGWENRKDLERSLLLRMKGMSAAELDCNLSAIRGMETGFRSYSSLGCGSAVGNLFAVYSSLLRNFCGDPELNKLAYFASRHAASVRFVVSELMDRFISGRKMLAVQLEGDIAGPALRSFDHVLLNETFETFCEVSLLVPRLSKVYSLTGRKVPKREWGEILDSISASLSHCDATATSRFLYVLERALERKAPGSCEDALEISFICAIGRNPGSQFSRWNEEIRLNDMAYSILEASDIYSLEAKRDLFSGMFMHPGFKVEWLSAGLVDALLDASNRLAKQIDLKHGNASSRDHDFSDFLSNPKLDVERMILLAGGDKSRLAAAVLEKLDSFLATNGSVKH